MKKHVFKIGMVFLGLTVIISCGETAEKGQSALSKLRETGKNVKAYTGVASSAKKILEETQALGEMEPADQEELKSWLPKEVNKYKRTKYESGDMSLMGVASFKSTFTHTEDSDKKSEFELIDGAGSVAGSMIATYKRRFDSSLEEESEDGFKQITKRNGYKAYEEQNNARKTAMIEFIHNDRFYIKLHGNNMTVDELWDLSEEIPLAQLDKF